MFKGDRKWWNAQKWLYELQIELDNDPSMTYRVEQLCKLLLNARETVDTFFPTTRIPAEDRARQAWIEEIASISLHIGILWLFDEVLSKLGEGLPDKCFSALGNSIISNDFARVQSRYHPLERYTLHDLMLTNTVYEVRLESEMV